MDLKLYLQLLLGIPCGVATLIYVVFLLYRAQNRCVVKVRKFNKFVKRVKRRYIYLTQLEREAM